MILNMFLVSMNTFYFMQKGKNLSSLEDWNEVRIKIAVI